MGSNCSCATCEDPNLIPSMCSRTNPEQTNLLIVAECEHPQQGQSVMAPRHRVREIKLRLMMFRRARRFSPFLRPPVLRPPMDIQLAWQGVCGAPSGVLR